MLRKDGIPSILKNLSSLRHKFQHHILGIPYEVWPSERNDIYDQKRGGKECEAQSSTWVKISTRI